MGSTNCTLQENLETEYPLLDSSLIAAFISDLPSETNSSHESLKDLHLTLAQLSLDAQADSNTSAASDLPGHSALGSGEPLGSENGTNVSMLDDVSPSVSGASSTSTSATSAASCASVLDFLHILFPHLARTILTKALNECCEPQDPDEPDLSAVVDTLLTLEYIHDLAERGLGDDETESDGWVTATARGKHMTAKPKPKARAKKYTISLVDIRQHQNASRIPVADYAPRSRSSSSDDPWTRLTSLSTRLSELLQHTTPGFFMSHFHSPVTQAPNNQTGWKGEGEALRNALSVLAASAAPVDEAAVDAVRNIVVVPDDHDAVLLDPDQCARLVADARLCVTAAQGDPDAAIDLVWLLHDLDDAFAQGEGIAHAVREKAVFGNDNHAAVSARTMTSPLARHPTYTLPTHPPPTPPPPSSTKHPPRAPSVHTDEEWRLVKHRRPPAETFVHPHADFIPAYSNRNLHTRRPVKGAGNQFVRGGNGDMARGVAWYKARMGEIQTQRNDALREATRHWQGGNTKSRGGEVAMYYAEKARELQEQQKEWALGAARAMVEEKRTTNTGLDLHGLTVPEACVIVKEALDVTPPTPECPLKIITGRGRHSAGRVSVLGPAVHEMLRSAGWRVNVWDGGLVVRGQV